MKPIYDSPEGSIYRGHALEVLRSMPDCSVNCAVSSPPYWGLRDYGLPPMVWDDPGGCEHEWGAITTPAKKRTEPSETVRKDGFKDAFRNSGRYVDHIADETQPSGQFCRLCGAWRGQLGLEPTPELFVQHIVQVFREVRRVIADDGTIWVNLGDSYNGSGKATGRCWENGKIPNLSQKQGTNSGSLVERMPNASGCKPKDLIGIPWLVAFALRADGWYLRSDIIWAKSNPMPESVTDRPTKAHEYIFLMSKRQRYFYDADAIRESWTCNRDDMRSKGMRTGQAYIDVDYETAPSNNSVVKKIKVPGGWDNKPGSHSTIHRTGRTEAEYQEAEIKSGRNKRSVWTVSTKPFPEAHFATFPPNLIEPCILAGCPKGGTVLDPFFGSGTTGIVAYRLERKFIGIELSETYINDIAVSRIKRETAQLKLFA